jgi:hypothetical protein
LDAEANASINNEICVELPSSNEDDDEEATDEESNRARTAFKWLRSEVKKLCSLTAAIEAAAAVAAASISSWFDDDGDNDDEEDDEDEMTTGGRCTRRARVPLGSGYTAAEENEDELSQ